MQGQVYTTLNRDWIQPNLSFQLHNTLATTPGNNKECVVCAHAERNAHRPWTEHEVVDECIIELSKNEVKEDACAVVLLQRYPNDEIDQCHCVLHLHLIWL